MATEREASHLESHGGGGLWIALLGAPLAFLAHLTVNYFLVPHACHADTEWPLHAVTLLALAVCALGAWQGARLRAATGRHLIAEGASRIERTRFLANVGLLATALFSLMILAQWLGILIFDACQRV